MLDQLVYVPCMLTYAVTHAGFGNERACCRRVSVWSSPRPCEMAFRINQNRWNHTESNGIPRNPTESNGIPRNQTESPSNPRNPTESTESHRIHGIPPNPRNPMESRRISDDSESRTENRAVADPSVSTVCVVTYFHCSMKRR